MALHCLWKTYNSIVWPKKFVLFVFLLFSLFPFSISPTPNLGKLPNHQSISYIQAFLLRMFLFHTSQAHSVVPCFPTLNSAVFSPVDCQGQFSLYLQDHQPETEWSTCCFGLLLLIIILHFLLFHSKQLEAKFQVQFPSLFVFSYCSWGSQSRDITWLTRVQIVEAMVCPVVMYGCESWPIKKAEHQRIDTFKLWCWRRLLRVPWTARR